MQAPLITVDEVASEEAFTLSEFSETSVSVTELPEMEPETNEQKAVPQTSDQESVTKSSDHLIAQQTNVQQTAKKSSDQQIVYQSSDQQPAKKSSEQLIVPGSTVKDKAEEEVIKKAGMAGAIARSFVVSLVATTLRFRPHFLSVFTSQLRIYYCWPSPPLDNFPSCEDCLDSGR